MKRRSQQSSNSLTQPTNNSHSQAIRPHSELSQELSLDALEGNLAQAKRKGNKKVKKTASANDMFDRQDQDVVDIMRGDRFIGEHFRPAFLKRWDGESNNLDLTQEELDSMSPMLRIYWEFKSKNMNCVIFVQMGHVEFLAFEDDAIKLHEILKKPLKKFSKYLMVNFWSKEIELAKVELFERRIPVLMLNEVEDAAYKEANGIFRREINEVITPSIFLSMEPKQFMERSMLVIFNHGDKCGIVCVDVETNHFYLEQLEDKAHENMHEIRRIINRYRPAEVLLQKADKEIKNMSKQICNPYIIQGVPMKGRIVQIVKQLRLLSTDPLFSRLTTLLTDYTSLDEQFSYYPIIMALGLLLNYLRNLGLEGKIIGQGIYEFIHFQTHRLKPMFDAQVYENLEIFNIKDEEDSFGKTGTLYHYLNSCLTNSGQRKLKKWMDEPLRSAAQITERQAAVSQLLSLKDEAFPLHKDFIQFEKLERRVGNIYHWALNPGQQGKAQITRDINFDKDYDGKKNPAVVRLKEIYDALQAFESAEKLMQKISSLGPKSKYLKKCCELIDVDNLYQIPPQELDKLTGIPSIKVLTRKLSSFYSFDKDTQIIEPMTGLNQVFDQEKAAVQEINEKLGEILQDWKKRIGASKISYISVRARNEIEVPLSDIKKEKFKELIFSSQTSKMIRYVTAETIQLSESLMQHEEAMARAYEPFMNMMVKQFCSHKYCWDLYLNALAELDVLLSLAKVSNGMLVRCMPKFVENEVHVKKGHHPGLLQVKKNENVIGNSLKMVDKERVLLLTGPNMGGKSTLLRQTCLLAIMAQIGCFVPAQEYECIVFDQIFCRIGASDRMIEGKSTFYVELEETKRIVDQATPDSLVIIDELGRGTSTYDGMALASAILSYIIEQIQCYTLFSTHYYPLTSWYSHRPEVQCAKIGYYFDKGSIRFTYQLEKGVAEKSFANQVAALVGICEETLAEADERAEQMELTNKLKAMMISSDSQLEEMEQFLSESA